MILQSRPGSGDLEGQELYLVRWEMGAGKVDREGDPVDRSWVPEALLQSTPNSSLLLQEYLTQQSGKQDALVVATADPDFAEMDFGARFDPRKAAVRKRTKIVPSAALKAWESHPAPLHLPEGAPDGLKPRDFLRVHRSLDNHGDSLVRMADVREMLQRLGVRLSVLEATEVLWEADDDHTGALGQCPAPHPCHVSAKPRGRGSEGVGCRRTTRIPMRAYAWRMSREAQAASEKISCADCRMC